MLQTYLSEQFRGDVVPEIVVAEKLDQGRRVVGNGSKDPRKCRDL